MIALLTLTLLVKSVLLLPVTPTVLEDDDVKVMECVVEALADVLSRPRPLPVSQQCLHTLRTDKRLLMLLRRYDFLKELQDVATQDEAMLNALGGLGERSILSQEPRRSEEEEDEGGEHGGIWTAGEKREEDDEREEEDHEESEEKRRNTSKEEEDKRFAEGEGMKKRSKGTLLRRKFKGVEKDGQKKAPHHSKEVSEEEEVKKKRRREKKTRNRSPEEKELQMISRRTPEEEDGSAARKSDDPEVENLAAIKSELENVSQKLHKLRQG
ncbi:chromogranin-A isoform X2 [Syngnathus acus]|uniref:chromogranin-A isoform X2 n=1 Tax=Syngnathus acus TaxID=161584 RepID=UPI0018860B98|nr:chromogranin-A isoform X2 [Syngnathus acus]